MTLGYRMARRPPNNQNFNIMEKYNYLENVKEDVKQYIQDNEIRPEADEDRDEFADRLNDLLWTADSVTGNGSGSYTFSTWTAEENICHNYDLLAEAANEFGCSDKNIIEKGAEWADVTIRCYLLGQAISAVLDELWDEIAPEESEEE